MRRVIALLALAAAPLPALAAQTPPTPGVGLMDIVQVLFGLAAVLAAIAASAWVFRRLGGARAGVPGPMKVVGSLGVGARERLVMVEVRDSWLLLGVAPGRVSMLHRLDKPDDLPAAAPPDNRFIDLLMKNAKRRP